MHFSWSMHLFIVLLFSRFSSGIKWDHAKSNVQDESHIYYPSIDDEHDRLQTSTKFTIFKSTTSTHQESIHDYPDVYHDEDENEDEEENSTTTFSSSSSSSSSSSDITQKTALITKTTTSEIETTTPFTLQNTEYENHELYYIPTTMGHQEIAKFKAKADRDRLLLKIFTITVAVGMSVLAIALFTIHLIQKRKRYQGYGAPADNLPKKTSV